MKYLFYQLADALAYCHKHYVVHRDIKCANIIVDKYGHAKIADWGLSNTFTGTPGLAGPGYFE